MSDLVSRPLGKTGLTVTRLSAGGHFTNGPCGHEDIPRRVGELNHMLDCGITYFDVQWEPEEMATAEVMKTRADEMIVAWPLHGVTQRGGDVTAQYVLDYCDDHRKRYGIDHVNILLWIALEVEAETQDAAVGEVRKAFEKLKADGFCDHLGFSCHHSPEMALRAVTQFDDFEVMMIPFGPLNGAGAGVLQAAGEKGIGTVGMKPFGGGGGFFNRVWSGEADHAAVAGWKDSSRPYEAALRWALANDHLDCSVPGMQSMQHVDGLVAAAAEPLGDEDKTLLQTMQAALTETGAEAHFDGAWD